MTPPSTRDEVRARVAAELERGAEHGNHLTEDDLRAILAALNPQPRQVTTAEELATCGQWAVAACACGPHCNGAWILEGPLWGTVGAQDAEDNESLARSHGPLTVVFEGVAGA